MLIRRYQRSAPMKLWLAGMILGIACLALAYFVSDALADSSGNHYDALIRQRPTFWQAHRATHIVLDEYTELVDGHLFVGPCHREGRYTTVCRARIDGPNRYRYRILVAGTRNENFVVTVRAR